MMRRVAWRATEAAAFCSMGAFILLTCYGDPWIGLAFGVVMLGCIVAAAGLDPEARWQRRRYYRRQQQDAAALAAGFQTRNERRRILQDIHPRPRTRQAAAEAAAIPRCADCRVIVFPDRTERIPCGWHADIKSVALERELTQ